MTNGLVASRLVLALTAIAAAAVFVAGGIVAVTRIDDDSTTPSSACAPEDGERPAKAILRCTEASIAFVETEIASGTGIIVEHAAKRYVLTNQHVVDPFDAADIILGDRVHAAVPVVGVDIGADIAVLGPLRGSRLPRPLAITPGSRVERGDDVYLVGFPGEAGSDELEATIASGIVSRRREVREFDQSYIQTDASIAGGQSGGPLFDASAKVIGISGLSFAEEFALVLSGRDVQAALERIAEGGGDSYLSLPAERRPASGSTSGTLRVFDASDGQVLFLPAAPEDRTWHVNVDMAANPIVSVEKLLDGDPLALSGNTESVEQNVAQQLAAARGGRPEDFASDVPDVGRDVAEREVTPGRFRIPVEAHESALVIVWAPLTDSPIPIGWQSDIPLFPASREVTERQLDIGGHVDEILGGLDTAVDVIVNLAEGQEVEVHARSPQGDPAFQVFGPGVHLDHLTMVHPEGAGIEYFDDTDDGLYGLDARGVIKAQRAGAYRIRLFINDYSAIKVRLSVVDCAATSCIDDA